MKENILFISKPSILTKFPELIINLFITALIFYFQPQIQNIFNQFIPDKVIFLSLNLVSLTILSFLSFVWLIFLIKVIVLKSTKYTFYETRLIYEHGILNRKKEFLEFFRIKDYSVEQPIVLRLFGLCNAHILSTDRTHPDLYLKSVNEVLKNEPVLRQHIDKSKESGRGREIDVV